MPNSPGTPAPRSRKAVRIAALYLVFASLWIFASDRFLTLALDDPELLIKISTAKGFAFVAITTLLLYLLLLVWDDSKTESDATPPTTPHMRQLLGVFLGLALIVPLVGFSIVRLHGPHVREDAFGDLSAIAALKADQIESWLDYRRGDAEELAGSAGLAMHAERLVLNGNADSRTYVVDRLKTITKAWDFESTALLNASGQVVVSATDQGDVSTLVRQQLLPAALHSGQVQRSDLYRDAAGHVHLDYVVPLPSSGGKRQAVAAVLLQAPVERFLFPLVQTWPTPSPSAETLLVRRDGDHALFLNKLRHRHDAALILRLPLDDPNYPAVAAILSGKAQVMEGMDYRGIAVLAVTRPVAGTPWHLVAKIDREEVMEPLKLLVFWVSLVGFVAVAAIAAAALLLWGQMKRAHQLELIAQATEKDRLLKLFYDMPFIGMSTTSPTSKRFLHVNDRLCEMLGYPREELLDLTWAQLTHPDDLASSVTQLERLLAGEIEGFQLDKRFVRKDGQIVDANLRVGCVRRSDGSVNLVVATAQDITERIVAEKALRESEKRYRSLFENMLEGFAYCRMLYDQGVPQDFVYLEVNRTFETLTGLKDVVGRKISEIAPGIRESDPTLFEIYGRTALSGKPERFETYVAALKTWFSIAVYSPAPEHFVAIFDVITERKKAEAEIRELNVNLEKKVEERTTQLKAINQELETFTYSVSHDLKAPLRGIDGYSQLLQEDHAAGLSTEGQTFIANIRRGAQQMSELIEDLLAYSRLERRPLQTARIAPENVADAVIEEFAEEIRRRHVTVNVAIPCLEVSADVDGLAMILRNLLDNALKFSRDTPQPVIEIGGREESETCILWVRDNGIGFDMKFQERIFEIFQRLQRAEDYPGTGIGLAIVHKAAQRMGGRVWAESTPGAGAAFYLELPK